MTNDGNPLAAERIIEKFQEADALLEDAISNWETSMARLSAISKDLDAYKRILDNTEAELTLQVNGANAEQRRAHFVKLCAASETWTQGQQAITDLQDAKREEQTACDKYIYDIGRYKRHLDLWAGLARRSE